MFRRVSITLLILVVTAAVYVIGLAQGKGPGQGTNGIVSNHGDVVTLTGTVRDIQIAAGQGMPSLTLVLGDSKQVTLMLGPYRVLANTNLDVKSGSRVSVEAIQSLRFENTFVALRIDNLDTGSSVTLRDSSGMPGWAGYGGRGHENMACSGCGECQIDLATKSTLVGTVAAVNMGFAQGFPNFTLTTDTGNITVIASPFRTLIDANYAISVGHRMSVIGFPSLRHEGAYVAAELTDSDTGASLVLRDAQGVPVDAGQGRGNCACAACR